jgi:hypothetical protein
MALTCCVATTWSPCNRLLLDGLADGPNPSARPGSARRARRRCGPFSAGTTAAGVRAQSTGRAIDRLAPTRSATPAGRALTRSRRRRRVRRSPRAWRGCGPGAGRMRFGPGEYLRETAVVGPPRGGGTTEGVQVLVEVVGDRGVEGRHLVREGETVFVDGALRQDQGADRARHRRHQAVRRLRGLPRQAGAA